LIAPNPESALNEEAGRLLLEEYEAFAKHAKLFTSIHAGPPNPSPFPAIAESENRSPEISHGSTKSEVAPSADKIASGGQTTHVKHTGVLEEGGNTTANIQPTPSSGSISPNRKRVFEAKKPEKTLAEKKKSLRRL
jgi:ubiquitin-conjugating enzyme E2 S